MNIAFFDATPHWSGGSKRVSLLAEGMKTLGHKVTVVCLPGSMLSKKCGESAGSGLDCITMKPAADIDPAAFFRIFHLLKKRAVQVIDINSPRFYWLAAYAGRCAGAKTVITRNVPFKKKGFKRFFNKKFLYEKVDRVVAISENIACGLKEDFGIDNVVTVYDGIPLPPSSGPVTGRREMLGITGDPVLGIFGRVCEGKGHAYLIEALKEVKSKKPEIKLVIVGAGEQGFMETLKRQISGLGLDDNVQFAGFLENILPWYSAVDAVVAPTLEEGLGMNILEACACGKPVVASDVGGVPEIVQDGVNGLLVKPADPVSLAAGILKLLNSDMDKFGDNGRKFVEDKFGVEEMIKECERLYFSLLK